AVQSREGEWANVPYLGRAHRAFVTPVKDLPWTLVVFRDKQIFRTINLQTMTLAAIAFMGYALLLAIAIGLLYLLRPEVPLVKTWPCQKHAQWYRRITLVNSMLFLIFIGLVLISSREPLIVWALFFPALAIAHALALPGSEPGQNPAKTPAS